MHNITVVFVDKGRSPHLFEMLDSIDSLADEIIVGDIGIEKDVLDRLKKISKLKIVSFDKPVMYVELIREELHKKATGEYILVLDPDEIVPTELVKKLQESMTGYDYVKIPRKNIIFGKWIEHSRWWPDYQVRFFKKGSVTWPNVLHTQPIALGKELILDAKEELAICHYNYLDLDEYLLKAPRYAKAQAIEDSNKSEPRGFTDYAKLGLSEFIGRYFSDNGYKDGMHGFTLSFLQMIYYFLVYFYVWELGGYKDERQENVSRNLLQFFADGLFEIGYWSKKKGLVKISIVKSKLHSLIRKIS